MGDGAVTEAPHWRARHPFAQKLLKYLDSGFDFDIKTSRQGNGSVEIVLEDGAHFDVVVIQTREARCKDCGRGVDAAQHIIECDGNGWDADPEEDE